MNIAAFKTYTTFSIIQHALSIIFLSALTSLQFHAQHASANEQTSYEWCEDFDGEFFIHSVPLQNPKAKPCAWVGREDFVAKRCEIAEARLYCPKLCNNCRCANNISTFTLNGQETNCARVFNNPTFWCNFPEAVSNCPLSCGACDKVECPTEAPPTAAPTIFPTTTKTSHPSIECPVCPSLPVCEICPSTAPSTATSTAPSTAPSTAFGFFETTDELQAAAKTWCENPDAWVPGYSDYNTYGPLDKWDISLIKNMESVFYGVSTNCDPPVGNWNVSHVTSFNQMFRGASAFNQNISGWNVSSGTDFDWMFRGASAFNQDISNWDVSNGYYFSFMFYYAIAFNQDICAWKDKNNVLSPTPDYFCSGAFSCGLSCSW